MTDMLWEVFAVKYADRNNRMRVESFILDPAHDQPHPMDYFVWVLKAGERVIMVDTGYDHTEAKRRGREILRQPVKAIEALGLGAEDVDDIIVTHLHYDHAGCLGDFPRAKIHIHPVEMAYATGPCMCEDALRMPFTGAHICDAVTALYSGRVRFTAEDDVVADGVTVHRIGGHSKGLQAVRVKTAAGWMPCIGRNPFLREFPEAQAVSYRRRCRGNAAWVRPHSGPCNTARDGDPGT
ncbi:MAG: hypothetical protein CM15mP60_2580 [Alphaproteobacteria bacterium]|nr:MAG: hypothetical protein CM15mP60_2580 [Alphaproteobacteria bacterium]